MSDTSKSVAKRSITSAEAIKKMEKELYREALMKDYDLKRGSKYPPMSIEPFPFERQRLTANYTDADRALRKQWLQDQILTDREPVHIERWVQRNVFRRMWNAPFNAMERVLLNLGASTHWAGFIRFSVPKLLFGAAVLYGGYLHHKVAPRTWETGVGIVAFRKSASNFACVPGTADWDRMLNGEFYREPSSFWDLGFQGRRALKGDKLVTSQAGPQLDGSVN